MNSACVQSRVPSGACSMGGPGTGAPCFQGRYASPWRRGMWPCVPAHKAWASLPGVGLASGHTDLWGFCKRLELDLGEPPRGFGVLSRGPAHPGVTKSRLNHSQHHPPTGPGFLLPPSPPPCACGCWGSGRTPAPKTADPALCHTASSPRTPRPRGLRNVLQSWHPVTTRARASDALLRVADNIRPMWTFPLLCLVGVFQARPPPPSVSGSSATCRGC